MKQLFEQLSKLSSKQLLVLLESFENPSSEDLQDLFNTLKNILDTKSFQYLQLGNQSMYIMHIVNNTDGVILVSTDDADETAFLMAIDQQDIQKFAGKELKQIPKVIIVFTPEGITVNDTINSGELVNFPLEIYGEEIQTAIIDLITNFTEDKIHKFIKDWNN